MLCYNKTLINESNKQLETECIPIDDVNIIDTTGTLTESDVLQLKENIKKERLKALNGWDPC